VPFLDRFASRVPRQRSAGSNRLKQACGYQVCRLSHGADGGVNHPVP
jgi:hypothetical protein